MRLILLSVILTLTTAAVIGQSKAYISTENAIEDINLMIETIEDIHYNPYFKIDKGDFNQSKEHVLNAFDEDSISYKEFITTGMKLAAQLSGGHTGMDWQNDRIIPELLEHKFVPFTGKPTNDNTHLVITRSTNSDLEPGALVESINGIPALELYEECMTYVGGIESFKRISIERALPLYLFFTDRISAPYSLKLFDEPEVIEVLGLDAQGLNTFINQSQDKENYIFEIVNDSIGLITYNSCEDLKTFEEFLKSTFLTVEQKGIDKVIIDIRENTGGDSQLNDLLLSYITSKPYRQSSGRYWKVSEQAKDAYRENNYENHFGNKFMKSYYEAENGSVIETEEAELIYPESPAYYFSGKTCFLIGPSTFSSANFLADAVKTYSLSTLIGSATGELTNDFGEMIYFSLPRSGNYVYVSSTYDIGANGDPELFEPVSPDIQTNEDALEHALNWLKE